MSRASWGRRVHVASPCWNGHRCSLKFARHGVRGSVNAPVAGRLRENIGAMQNHWARCETFMGSRRRTKAGDVVARAAFMVNLGQRYDAIARRRLGSSCVRGSPPHRRVWERKGLASTQNVKMEVVAMCLTATGVAGAEAWDRSLVLLTSRGGHGEYGIGVPCALLRSRALRGLLRHPVC